MKDEFDLTLPIPLKNGIVMVRVGQDVWTNVPAIVRHHSPTGYEWGYGGSGPADFALNVVETLLRLKGFKGPKTDDTWDKTEIFKASWALHQDFKSAFLLNMPEQGGVLSLDRVWGWIKNRIYFGDVPW